MKHKIAELEGALLDAAVAKAQGWEIQAADGIDWWWSIPSHRRGNPSDAEAKVAEDQYDHGYRPSINWQEAGQIIERERIELSISERGEGWWANLYGDIGLVGVGAWGSTPLIAAMRAYVASKFRQEVELP